MDNEIKIKGTVAVLCPLMQGRSKSTGALWQSQVFVLDTGGRFSSKVPIKLFGETIEFQFTHPGKGATVWCKVAYYGADKQA